MTPIPGYIQSMLKLRTRFSTIYTMTQTYADQFKGEYGMVYRIRPWNTYGYRETFLRDVTRFVAWAQRNGSDAHIISVNQPGAYLKSRSSDYIILQMTDPVILRLEKSDLLEGMNNPTGAKGGF